MRKLSLLFVAVLFSASVVSAQDINRQKADSIIKVLNTTKPGVGRIDLLLTLAQFHIFKPGEDQIDFDSANIYINEAAALNTELKSTDAAGYLLLTQSFIKK